MTREHHYTMEVEWTGNLGTGTSSYKAYDRAHVVRAPGKPDLPASSDPSFRGDRTRYNPEELLVASLSSCHMLWFLHLCAEAGVVVVSYTDHPAGTMVEEADGSGRFVSVVLRPEVVVAEAAMTARVDAIHERAHHLCFVAASVNFPVRCEGSCGVG